MKPYPLKDGCYCSIQTAYDYLISKGKEVILLGQSIGTDPTCELASTRDVLGVILVSPFMNPSKMVSINVPTMIIHGTNDELIPIQHAKKLYSKLREKYRAGGIWVQGAGHNDIFTRGTVNRIRDFILIIWKIESFYLNINLSDTLLNSKAYLKAIS